MKSPTTILTTTKNDAPFESNVRIAEIEIVPSDILGELDEYSVADVYDRKVTMDAVIRDLKINNLYKPDLLYRMFYAKRMETLLNTGTDRSPDTCNWKTPRDDISQEDKTFLSREKDLHVFSYLIGDYRDDGEFGIAVFSPEGFESAIDGPFGYAFYRPEFIDKKRKLIVAVYRVVLQSHRV